MSNLNLKGLWIPIEILTDTLNTPIEEKFKDNKYNNDKQNFKKTKANFEERAYEGFNFDTLYANYNMMKGTS